MNTFIIAEAGLNYGGSLACAKDYCYSARETGASAVKFQVTDVNRTLNNSHWSGNSELMELIKACEMPEENWMEVKRYCDSIGIEFMATPSTIDKLEFLMALGMKKIKIGSDRSDNIGLLSKAYSYNVPVLVGCGKYYVDDYRADKLHCVSEYPAYIEDYTLYAVNDDYSGMSDHTLETGIEIPLIVVSKGWKYYEKHFKLSDNCIDYHTSLFPKDFKKLIDNFKRAEMFLGVE